MIIDQARKKLCIFDIFAPENFDAYCVADKCMAWRWRDPAIKHYGYCGLAGKEGAEGLEREEDYR